MVEPAGMEFDPRQHSQAPPVVPLRDALAQEPPQRLRQAPIPPQPVDPPEDVQPALIEMARAVSRIVATRVLLLLAVVTASGLWVYTIWNPNELRIIAGAVYAVLVLGPLVWLYWRVK